MNDTPATNTDATCTRMHIIYIQNNIHAFFFSHEWNSLIYTRSPATRNEILVWKRFSMDKKQCSDNIYPALIFIFLHYSFTSKFFIFRYWVILKPIIILREKFSLKIIRLHIFDKKNRRFIKTLKSLLYWIEKYI